MLRVYIQTMTTGVVMMKQDPVCGKEKKMSALKHLIVVGVIFTAFTFVSSSVLAQEKNQCKNDSTVECQHTSSCKKNTTCDTHGKKECPMMGTEKINLKTSAADTALTQKTCPVTGEPINKSVYLDYQSKRIYFCCENCKAAFLKSPEKYPIK
jgi:YHS domain-containing protein